MTTEAARVLGAVLGRLPATERSPLVLGPEERPVPASRVTDRGWLTEQLRLRGERWSTDDARVLGTLWWYSASAWVIGPTLASLVLGESVLSAHPDDLELHWLPDSRITGATSTRVLSTSGPAVLEAARTIRQLYDRVIPALATLADMRPRPLWAIAADALADRLLWLGRACDDLDRATSLLDPLVDAVGRPLPRARYERTPAPDGPRTHRCSCCLLYLTPSQHMCGSCPRARSQEIGRR
jgi:hypothetical protein